MELRITNNFLDKRLFVRILLVEDKQPQFDDVTQNMFMHQGTTATPTNLTAGDNFDMIKSINKQRYTVHSDKVYSIGPDSNENTRRAVRFIKRYFKVNRKFKFNTEVTEDQRTTPIWRVMMFVRNDINDAAWGANSVARDIIWREYFNK